MTAVWKWYAKYKKPKCKVQVSTMSARFKRKNFIVVHTVELNLKILYYLPIPYLYLPTYLPYLYYTYSIPNHRAIVPLLHGATSEWNSITSLNFMNYSLKTFSFTLVHYNNYTDEHTVIDLPWHCDIFAFEEATHLLLQSY